MKILATILFLLLSAFSFQVYARSGLLERRAREYREEGYRLQSAGDLRGALSFYQKTIEMDPFYVEAYNDIGVIYEKQGRIDDAKRLYKKAIEVNPNFMPAYANLAFLYEQEGNTHKAAYYWRERYTRGMQGEYWHAVARERLQHLGIYP